MRTVDPLTIAGVSSAGEVDAVVYDFGVVCLRWHLPISGTIADLSPLAMALYENRELLTASKKVARELLDRLGLAVSRPSLSDLVEDYVVFHAESWEGQGDAAAFLAAQTGDVARLLRAEGADLSSDEIAESLGVHASYTRADAAVIDWNAALLLGPDQEDVLAVLEFANIELLEGRYLDARLDTALTEAYEAVQRGPGLLPSSSAANLRRIAGLQVDSALLFEGVNNALKLIGDQYLARVYRLIGRRLHLPEWDASILRKLGTLEAIYDKVNDRQATRRMELLEWIIIILITLSLVASFVKF
jgi:hypothetical protein